MRARFLRLFAGLLVLALLLPLLFALTIPLIHRWGATAAEVAQPLPGDELLADPLLNWTHAITIDAPPEVVWPWIAQLGDERGGFYSFTFIENRVGALTGAEGYTVVYRNANTIVPEWQDPQPGDGLIQGILNVHSVQPGTYLLGSSVDPETFGWTWLWQLSPLNAGAQTRLIVRFGIWVPPAGQNPALLSAMDLGGFVMEQRMLHGIKLRAEGWREPAWHEAAEIGLWVTALLSGLVAAGMFVWRRNWRLPLAIAIAAVLVLFVLTFVQPPLWVRLALNGALIGGIWHALQSAPRRRSSPLVRTGAGAG
jgi:hypothetical protein